MHHPYNLENRDGSYYFTTDSSITYRIIFSTRTDFPSNGEVNVYDFSFAPEGIAHTDLPSHDARVYHTIKEAIERFFRKITNALLFVCDSSDDKAPARKRLFEYWHKSSSCDYIEKHDVVVPDDESELEYYSSILIHCDAPSKDEIIFKYKELGAEYASHKN